MESRKPIFIVEFPASTEEAYYAIGAGSIIRKMQGQYHVLCVLNPNREDFNFRLFNGEVGEQDLQKFKNEIIESLK